MYEHKFYGLYGTMGIFFMLLLRTYQSISKVCRILFFTVIKDEERFFCNATEKFSINFHNQNAAIFQTCLFVVVVGNHTIKHSL